MKKKTADSRDKPQHIIELKSSFEIGIYEVTFNEYDRFAIATLRKLPDDNTWGRGDRPVVNVSWFDAVEYTEWLSDKTDDNYRLPTEAEWEYAVRGGTKTAYWWGDEISQNNANCENCASTWGLQTVLVSSYKANPWGLYNVHGNAQEFVQDDWHSSYKMAPDDGSAWKEGGPLFYRVVRGGSFRIGLMRAAYRAPIYYSARDSSIGFRIVREPQIQH